ncbi:hypothetical protein C2E31_04460 [Rhodopirellula baltica]|nr:hypothetical protein C2E31_04460 [Rhodopirellula baltica]
MRRRILARWFRFAIHVTARDRVPADVWSLVFRLAAFAIASGCVDGVFFVLGDAILNRLCPPKQVWAARGASAENETRDAFGSTRFSGHQFAICNVQFAICNRVSWGNRR